MDKEITGRMADPRVAKVPEKAELDADRMADFAGEKLSVVFRQVHEKLKARSIYQSWPSDECEIQTRFEAETLLLYATGLSRIRFLTSLSERLSGNEADRLQNAVSKRFQSMPLGYIVSKVNFYGRDFVVGPGCLIPRPETEILVEEAVRWTLQHKPDAHIYDLGCGSGAISVTLALECPEAHVEAVDISEAALNIAKANATGLGASTKVLFSHKDGLKDLRERQNGPVQAGQMQEEQMQPTGKPDWSLLDVLVTNPPYIPSADVLTLEPDVRDYEPHLALDGGADGLDFYRAILAIGEGMFVPVGPAAFFMEVGINQADVLLRELSDGRYAGWYGWTFGVKHDLRGVPRVVYGERADPNQNRN
jgi:release factor glutamine methyltransferase